MLLLNFKQKKTAKNQDSSMKNGAIYVYERFRMLHLIEDVFIVFITFEKSCHAVHGVTK